jgi:hypothetical protein
MNTVCVRPESTSRELSYMKYVVWFSWTPYIQGNSGLAVDLFYLPKSYNSARNNCGLSVHEFIINDIPIVKSLENIFLI